MTTRIECTKDEFPSVLTRTFLEPIRGTEHETAEILDVVNDLVRQANTHRGTFIGYSDYLDLDFEVGGIRDSGEPTVIGTSLDQCNTHGVSIGGLCCDHSIPLGRYGPTERVRCAKCEESIRDPRFAKYDGREFGATSTDGAVCRWCSLHDHPADFDCTSSCPSWVEPITIPAVTDAQRVEHRAAARETVRLVGTELCTLVGTGRLTQGRLAAEIHKLMAALGHLTIAES